ncbi:migration and invasion-inhibitory protein isoform X2 [Monodon monoceros]|uniref:migration and invasion-inhibitory protein isoform X2 n=1 Tax=Monodon monoceros TaxID=40151 RepID=UPI0010F5CF41|nr:migration and invasion-inhibitory protein isoform X2 [Monodon monoceros]
MVETRDLAQLRQLNLELLRQLWVGQDAVRRSVAKAASESSLDSSSSYNSEMPSSQETSSVASRASPQDAHQGDPCDRDGASSGVVSLPPAKCLHQESPGPLRPRSAPLLATSDSSDPELSAELESLDTQEAQALKSLLAQRSKLSEFLRQHFGKKVTSPIMQMGRRAFRRQTCSKSHVEQGGGQTLVLQPPSPRLSPGAHVRPRVTNKESPVPEKSWRLRPCLGYDWIAGSPDNSSPVTSKPEAFFSKLQKFREANKEECICSDPESQFLGLQESSAAEGDHECVYCYCVNRRLFLVPSDPRTPCRLCRTPRGQRGPETLAEPAQVRVSIPLSVLDPPHRYHIHRRKSFDASDTLALPRHCLLGWDILPPKSEKSSAPKSLDLWSSVSSEAQRRKLSATSPSHRAVPTRVPAPTLIWSEPSVPQPRAAGPKP